MNNEIMMLVCVLREFEKLEKKRKNKEMVRFYRRLIGGLVCEGMILDEYKEDEFENSIGDMSVEFEKEYMSDENREKVVGVFRGLFNYFYLKEEK